MRSLGDRSLALLGPDSIEPVGRVSPAEDALRYVMFSPDNMQMGECKIWRAVNDVGARGAERMRPSR